MWWNKEVESDYNCKAKLLGGCDFIINTHGFTLKEIT